MTLAHLVLQASVSPLRSGPGIKRGSESPSGSAPESYCDHAIILGSLDGSKLSITGTSQQRTLQTWRPGEGTFKGLPGSRMPASLQQAQGCDFLQRLPRSLEWEKELAPLRNVFACVARHTMPTALPQGCPGPRERSTSCACCPGLQLRPKLLCSCCPGEAHAQAFPGLCCGTRAGTDGNAARTRGRRVSPPCREKRLLTATPLLRLFPPAGSPSSNFPT